MQDGTTAGALHAQQPWRAIIPLLCGTQGRQADERVAGRLMKEEGGKDGDGSERAKETLEVEEGRTLETPRATTLHGLREKTDRRGSGLEVTAKGDQPGVAKAAIQPTFDPSCGADAGKGAAE